MFSLKFFIYIFKICIYFIDLEYAPFDFLKTILAYLFIHSFIHFFVFLHFYLYFFFLFRKLYEEPSYYHPNRFFYTTPLHPTPPISTIENCLLRTKVLRLQILAQCITECSTVSAPLSILTKLCDYLGV